jgi:hypothetical protein
LARGHGFDLKALFPASRGYEGRIAEHPPEIVTLLKPHGSVSWRSEAPSPMIGSEEAEGLCIRFGRGDLEGLERIVWLGTKEASSTEPPDGEQERRPPRGFLMPSFVKSYADTVPFIRHMWHLAYKAIRESTDLWIIGYSIPEADTDAHLLLSALPRDPGQPSATPDWTVNIADREPEEVADRMRRIVSLNSDRVHVRSKGDFEDCDWAALLADE